MNVNDLERMSNADLVKSLDTASADLIPDIKLQLAHRLLAARTARGADIRKASDDPSVMTPDELKAAVVREDDTGRRQALLQELGRRVLTGELKMPARPKPAKVVPVDAEKVDPTQKLKLGQPVDPAEVKDMVAKRRRTPDSVRAFYRGL